MRFCMGLLEKYVEKYLPLGRKCTYSIRQITLPHDETSAGKPGEGIFLFF